MRRVFISYCQKQNEKDWLSDILEFLNPLFAKHGLRPWLDNNIPPGDDWEKAITEAIDDSRVALLLVTPGFLASEFITNTELPLILAGRQKGLLVYWIPVSRGIWQAGRLREVQAALDPKQFLENMGGAEQRVALEKIAEKLEKDLLNPPAVPAEAILSSETSTIPATKKIQVAVDAHDIASIERLAQKTKLSEHAFLSGFLHDALYREELHITYRHESEIQGRDELLRTASDAQFIALTYKTLGLALTEGKLTLPEAIRVEMAVYPLPILRSWHPTLRGDASEVALRDEWLQGVGNVLKWLTLRSVAPKLETLDLRIINRVPTFTSSLLTTKSSEGDLLRIRFTPSLEDMEPSATPTMNLVLFTGEGARPEPVFQAYARVIDNMRTRSRPLVFPIVRRGDAEYVRPKLGPFVERLASTTNDGRYGLPDAQFAVTLSVDMTLAKQFGLMSRNKPTSTSVQPSAIYHIFDELRASGKTSLFTVDFDLSHHKALIRLGDPAAQQWVTLSAENPHIVGVFAVLTKEGPNGRLAVLKSKPKQWPFDVPGGKVAYTDESIQETLGRELFEELGIDVRPEAIKEICEFKYDPLGKQTQTPVIAVYFHYRLNDAEVRYLEKTQPNATDGFPLKDISVKFLVDNKRGRRHEQHGQRFPAPDKDRAESMCHAPLEVFLQIQQEPQASGAAG